MPHSTVYATPSVPVVYPANRKLAISRVGLNR